MDTFIAPRKATWSQFLVSSLNRVEQKLQNSFFPPFSPRKGWKKVVFFFSAHRFLPQSFAPFELIKYNVEQDEPVRDERGLCIRVRPGKKR